eukprot:1157900-Pelagomonas_calceolata.AAC.19
MGRQSTRVWGPTVLPSESQNEFSEHILCVLCMRQRKVGRPYTGRALRWYASFRLEPSLTLHSFAHALPFAYSALLPAKGKLRYRPTVVRENSD